MERLDRIDPGGPARGEVAGDEAQQGEEERHREKARGRDVASQPADSLPRLPELNQGRGVAIGERLEEHAPDHARERGQGADSESEGRYRRRGETPLPCEGATSEADVLEERVEADHGSR